MNNNRFFICFVFLSTVSSTPLRAVSLKSVRSLFTPSVETQTVHKEFSIEPNSTVLIENIYGNIYIKTEWSQHSIILSADTKIAQKEANPIEILHEQPNDSTLTIKTVAKNPKSKSSMDLTLIVPTSVNLDLMTNNGTITTDESIGGAITAVTHNGHIHLKNTRSPVHATAHNNGTVTIEHAHNDLKIKTKNGMITVYDSKKNVMAESGKGAISIQCKELPAYEKIFAKTTSGPVTLNLPSAIDANVHVATKRGTVTSDIPITLKSFTTTLDKKSWTQFKREINGSIGNGSATIKVSSQSSSVKIKKVMA